MEGCSRFHIPALFSRDFFSAGFTLMPNLILKYSSRLNLGSADILVLLACFYFQQKGENELECADFANLLNVPENIVKASVEAMAARGFFYISGNSYDLTGLFEKIADLWAEEKVLQEARQEVAATAQALVLGNMQSTFLSTLLQRFEQEFGRALSPIENATIISWSKDKGYSESIILEALKRAVLRGVVNLTYIDRILTQWARNNLRTAQEVNKYEEQYLSSRQSSKGKSKTRTEDNADKYKDFFVV